MRTINTRDKGYGELYGPDVHERPLDKAFEYFAMYELGFGGRVTDFSETSVTTVTRVMNCVDTTRFEGTAQELQPFLQLAAVHTCLLTDDKVLDALSSAAFQTMERMFSKPGGGVSPLKLKLGGDQIIGQLSLKVSLLTAFGLDRLKYLPAKELVNVIMLILGGEDKEEVIKAYEIPESAGPLSQEAQEE